MTTATRNALSPLIFNIPRTDARDILAAEILVAGHVQRHPDDCWIVTGSSSQPYRVSIRAGTCDCPDEKAPLGENGEKLCKHMRACLLAVEVDLNQEIVPDPDALLWLQPVPELAEGLDAEIAAKLDQLTAAGLDADADLLVIGDWIWLVGDVDADLADSLGCRWHDRRGVHYWRPVWAAMDPDGFNEKKDLAGLAEKYGLKRSLPRRSRRVEKSKVEMAMLLVPKLNRDEDGELWA